MVGVKLKDAAKFCCLTQDHRGEKMAKASSFVSILDLF